MTLDLARHLRLPADVSEPLMGKPVMYMVVRVAGLPAHPTPTQVDGVQQEPWPWVMTIPYVSFVLHDPAEMRRTGDVIWVPQAGNTGGFRLRVTDYPEPEPPGPPLGNPLALFRGAHRIRDEFPPPPVTEPPPVVVDEDSEEDDEGADDDSDGDGNSGDEESEEEEDAADE